MSTAEEEPYGNQINIRNTFDFENAKKLQAQDPTKPIVTNVWSNNYFTTPATLAQMVDAFPFLLRLNLGGCTRITDAELSTIAKLTFLRVLYLTNTKVTDAGLQQLTKLAHLELVSFHKTSITNSGLQHLLNLPSLDPEKVFTDGAHVSQLLKESFKKQLRENQAKMVKAAEEKAKLEAEEKAKEEAEEKNSASVVDQKSEEEGEKKR
jgi:hypothetical protein